ncbi:MAG: DUF4838 domain-containing protein [Clostridia bacterium]|nr:DUF4838 domain-containing protein [Clostridia bacterium]
MVIRTLHKDETSVYAAQELKKYLDMMCEGFCTGIEYTHSRDTDGAIVLALMSDLGLGTPEVKDPVTDDIMYVDVKNGEGYIAGSNIRSILLSVYVYLKHAGCRFIRPGKDGEYIPKRGMSDFSCKYRHAASYPFRGECIEGAVSFEHVRDTIIWSPKVGMNMFMMEQVVPYNYISRWYKHLSNTVLEDEKVSFEQVREYVKELDRLIKKVGLQHHALGHGYLLEPYGVHYIDRSVEYHLSDEAVADTALVKGKRGLFSRSPNFTQLCYSRADVRKKLLDWLVSYVKEKPFIDFLHVWLSDSTNNQCECESCKPHRVSDLYVAMLNELDEALTAEGFATKVVFILYVDTMWAPLYEKIKNPDRFIMLTAVTGRDYSKPYDDTPYTGATPEYVKNDYRLANSFPMTLRMIDEWKRAFDGRKLVYEYHMYTHHFDDPGYMRLSELLLQDCKNIGAFGFDGIISDQTQRSFFPNGLAMSAFAAGMYDTATDFDAFAEEYFEGAYGEDYKLAKDYLCEISHLMSPDVLQVKTDITNLDDELGKNKRVKHRGWVGSAEMQENFRRAMVTACEFEPVARAHMGMEDPTHARSWMLLYRHTDYVRRYADTLLARSLGDNAAAQEKYREMMDALSKIEPELAPEFDLHLFDNSIKRKLK